ncbi:MAG: VWA domain-containing protein [Kiritimatiellales bacterium]|nr:VWA domain-containing protein [Kiritimatiellales bacterium]
MLLIPLFVWLKLRMQRKQTMQFSSGEILARLPKGWRVRLQPALPVLYALGLICLSIALARPQRGLQESRVRTEAVDIILLLDLSTSMEEADFEFGGRRMRRIDSAKRVIKQFVEKRTDDRIGMVAFAALPYAVAPLTLDHSWLLQRLDGLHTQMLEDGTAIGDGIASAINRLRDSEAKSKLVILLTDGINNRGTLSPENAAQASEALGIKIYTIGAGGGMPVQRGFFSVGRAQIDEKTLKDVAEKSGGKYYRARDMEALEKVYDEIDQLEKTEIEVEQFTRFQEISKPWIVAGILFLVLEQLLGLSKLGRLP